MCVEGTPTKGRPMFLWLLGVVLSWVSTGTMTGWILCPLCPPTSIPAGCSPTVASFTRPVPAPPPPASLAGGLLGACCRPFEAAPDWFSSRGKDTRPLPLRPEGVSQSWRAATASPTHEQTEEGKAEEEGGCRPEAAKAEPAGRAGGGVLTARPAPHPGPPQGVGPEPETEINFQGRERGRLLESRASKA